MINTILQLLKDETFYGKSEAIDIAKGKYHLKTKLKDIAEQEKRKKAWR